MTGEGKSEGGEGELEVIQTLDTQEIANEFDDGKNGKNGKKAHETVGKLAFGIFDSFGVTLRINKVKSGHENKPGKVENSHNKKHGEHFGNYITGIGKTIELLIGVGEERVGDWHVKDPMN